MEYFAAVIAFGGLFVGLSVVLIVAERLLINYGICVIDINSGGRTLEVDGGQTLLSGLYSEKIFIPSACGGRSSCGFCKLRVLSGGGPVLPTETPFLTRKENRSGVRLACQVKIKEDIQIQIPEDMLDVKLFSATVKSTCNVTYDIKEITFSLIVPEEIHYRPGQYIQIEAPSPEGPVFRAYSISSPSYENNSVELNIRLVPEGIGSTYLHNLNENDLVAFTGPYGDFKLNEDPSVEIICVGGGCGMAPMKNIIYSLYDQWPERSCWLFFGCRTTKDVFYLKEFQELAKKHPSFKVIYALSDPLNEEDKWDGETGFIHLSVDKSLDPNVSRQAFLCGPPPMIEAVMRVLEDKGMPENEIFYDKF